MPTQINARCGIITHNKGKLPFLNALQNTFAGEVTPLVLTGLEPREEIMNAVREYIDEGTIKGVPVVRGEPVVDGAPVARPDVVLLETNLGAHGSTALSFDRTFFVDRPGTRFVLFSEADTGASIAAANLPDNVIHSFSGVSPSTQITEVRNAYQDQADHETLDLPAEPVAADPYDTRPAKSHQSGLDVDGRGADGKEGNLEPGERPVVKTDLRYGPQFGPKPEPKPLPKGPR
ncbi:hypothetical protein [Burkholderia glumae]|uniref:hypothetical protein n=1 Tax=Burkholderia glumae TaxID=337 RepID=UPI002150C8F6|nr:hypothetical protein [Burkholderia glumae]